MNYYNYHFDNDPLPLSVLASTITVADKVIKGLGKEPNRSIVSYFRIELLDLRKLETLTVNALDKKGEIVPGLEEIHHRGIVKHAFSITSEKDFLDLLETNTLHYDSVIVYSSGHKLFAKPSLEEIQTDINSISYPS